MELIELATSLAKSVVVAGIDCSLLGFVDVGYEGSVDLWSIVKLQVFEGCWFFGCSDPDDRLVVRCGSCPR